MSKTIQEYITERQMRMRAVQIPMRTDRVADAWDRNASHYVCTIEQVGSGRMMAVQYSMGSAHTKPPKIADVLNSLKSDASGADQSFEHWCGDCGYDTDSRKAYAIYEECRHIAERLRVLLGSVAYTELLNEVEGL